MLVKNNIKLEKRKFPYELLETTKKNMRPIFVLEGIIIDQLKPTCITETLKCMKGKRPP